MSTKRSNLLTPARGNENLVERAFQSSSNGLKDILASGRKHNRPKQAFGELKNVLHLQDVQQSNNKKETIKCTTKPNAKIEKTKTFDFDDFDFHSFSNNGKCTEEIWSEKIAFTAEENDRIMKPQLQTTRTKPITVEELEELIEHEYGKNFAPTFDLPEIIDKEADSKDNMKSPDLNIQPSLVELDSLDFLF